MNEMFRIDLDELRKLADKQEWMVEKEFLLAVAKELGELRDRLEAAEKDIALKEKLIDQLAMELNATAHKHDALRAKIEQMGQQEPEVKP